MEQKINRLKLERPLAVIDIESTGTNREQDRIIEIAVCKRFPDGSREVNTRRVNPGRPIPASSTEIHGIKDEDVANCPPFAAIAGKLYTYLDGCDIAGFGSNHFDVPLLYHEFNRAGIDWDYTKFRMIDAGNIFKIQEPRTLEAAVSFYLGTAHDNAHSAEADAIATLNVLLAQFEKYEELPVSLDELQVFSNHGKPILDLSGKFSTNEAGDIILNFGPHRSERAADHLDFIQWMYYKDFPPDTTRICQQILFGDKKPATQQNLFD